MISILKNIFKYEQIQTNEEEDIKLLEESTEEPLEEIIGEYLEEQIGKLEERLEERIKRLERHLERRTKKLERRTKRNKKRLKKMNKEQEKHLYNNAVIIQCFFRIVYSKKKSNDLRSIPDNLFCLEFSSSRKKMLNIDDSCFN